MSEQADRERAVKRSWARPGGAHDILVRMLKIGLPVAVGLLLAYVFLSPLSKDKEVSFLLDKNKVEVAKERMKVQSAQYRGLDDKGRPFTVNADRALQPSSTDPIVQISGMSAEMQLPDGQGRVTADRGRYNLDNQKVDVIGPIHVTAPQGYRLQTRDVTMDFNSKKLSGQKGVEGQMPLGRFSASRLEADLRQRNVKLSGRARLHIEQGALR
jgi:lipopolysaccharide export system protein LptC